MVIENTMPVLGNQILRLRSELGGQAHRRRALAWDHSSDHSHRKYSSAAKKGVSCRSPRHYPEYYWDISWTSLV